MPPAFSRRSRRVIVVATAVVFGVLAATHGAAPTGLAVFDAIAVAVVIGCITWVSAVAPWWVLLLASAGAAATSVNPLLLGFSIACLVASGWIGLRRRTLRVTRAIVAGITLNVLLRSELEMFVGASTIVGVAIGLLLIVTSTRRRTRSHQRWIAAVCITLGALLGLGAAAQGAAVLAARSTLVGSIDDVRSGLELLADGDTEAAVQQLNLAARDMNWAVSTIDASWTQPARLIPIVAQNRKTLLSLARDARSLTRVLAAEVSRIDLDALKPQDGRVDLEQVATVSSAAEQILQSIESLRANIDDSGSVWLAGPVAQEIGDLRLEIDRRMTDAQAARDAIYMVPKLLGAEGPRRYFIAFTTPAEARAGGGFMGSWAEVVADRGRITLERTGRTKILNETGWPQRRVTGPADFLTRYGASGFSYPDTGQTASDVWSVINLSPHFPSTAQVITELYPQSGGKPLDGVISLDAYALATLVDFTGPITLTTIDKTLDGENAAQFLLYDQYRLEETPIERVDVLEEVTQQVVERILQGALPDPTAMVDQILPLARSGRITAYSVHEEEQALFERVHIDGALEAGSSGDALSVSFNNASANKIDAFLDAHISYDLSIDMNDQAESTASITLTNSAPRSGWPRYTIGNSFGGPLGTNRLWVTVHSRLPVESASIDGVDHTPIPGGEQDLYTSDFVVDIPSGAELTIVLKFAGFLSVDENNSIIPLTLRLPAAVRPVPATVTFTDADGATVSATVERPGTHRGLVPG